MHILHLRSNEEVCPTALEELALHLILQEPLKTMGVLDNAAGE